MRFHRSSVAVRSGCVGVRRIRWSAGKSVNTTTHEMASPTATQRPMSRIGRMAEIVSAANPTPVAKTEAVQATNLLASAKVWCSSRDLPGGRSAKRECR
jgi:hypothetical protein